MYFKFGRPYNSLDINTFDILAAPGFEGAAFPIIRRVFTRLLADDIVSVQAMGEPRGILHYIGGIQIKINSFKFGRNWKQQ